MNFRVGIDNYGLFPLGLDPMQTLQWAVDNDAEGVAFSGLSEDMRAKCTPDYLKSLAEFAANNNLYLEWGGGQHIPRDLGNLGNREKENWEIRELEEINRKSAEEANILGTSIIRSCSGGLMRWNPDSLPTLQLMEEMAEELSSQLQMLRDYKVVLAIETHFEFTTFELLQVFDWCGIEPGDCIGICLDTMNLLTMLEDPISAADRILPWVVSTHIKDGALLTCDQGLKSYTSPIGKGIIDLKLINDKLKSLGRPINLSIEDHGGKFDLPINDPRFLKEFPDLTTEELGSLMMLAGRSEKLKDEGSWKPMPREEWPAHCEARIKEDIVSLKELVNG